MQDILQALILLLLKYDVHIRIMRFGILYINWSGNKTITNDKRKCSEEYCTKNVA